MVPLPGVLYGVIMKILLTSCFSCIDSKWHTLGIGMFVVCAMAIAAAVVFLVSRRFIDRELNILYTKKYTLFDKLMVVISSTLLSSLLIGVCAFGVGAFAKSYLPHLDIYYEKIIVIYTTVLTLGYSLIAPNHSKLRLIGITAEKAHNTWSTLVRIISISFCLISLGLLITNITTNNDILHTEEWVINLIICAYYSIEFSKSRKAIASSFTITKTSEYSIAEKLTSFINNKFVFISLAGMIGMIVSDYALSKRTVLFYEDMFNIYQFIIVLYLLQLALSTIINKFVNRIELLENHETSRRKNLIWICDVTVTMTYFIVVCYVLQYIGIDVVTYLFHSKIIGSLLVIFISSVLYSAFKEFMNAYQDSNFKSFFPLLSVIFNFILFSITILVILENIGIGIAPILASFTVINAAIAWAAQDVLKSFIQGIMLLIEKGLVIGDYVDINGTAGVVEKLSVRVVSLRCTDGGVMIIPYSQVNAITNFSRGYNVVRDVLRICDPKDIPETIQLLDDTSKKILLNEKYRNNVFGKIEIEGIGPYEGHGIEIRWSLTTANGTVSFLFKNELYLEMAQLLRSRNIRIPVGQIYEKIEG